MAHVYEVGDKGKTRSGADYEVLMIEPRLEWPLIVLITMDNRQPYVSWRLLDGSFYRDKSYDADLIPPVRCVYLNLYKDGSVLTFTTEAAARNAALNVPSCFNRVAFRVELPS